MDEVSSHGELGALTATLGGLDELVFTAGIGEHAPEIRVHAISSGPLKTSAASGIDHFDDLLDLAAKRAPARQLVSIEDVGVATAVLATDYAKLITGETVTSSGSPKSLICIKAQSAFADSFSAAHSRPAFAQLVPS
jgi:acetate kinase